MPRLRQAWRWREWRWREWRRAALFSLLLVVPPLVAGLVLPPGPDRLTLTQAIAWLMFNACVLAAASMLYLRWRITGEDSIAHLTAAALAVGVMGLPLATVDVASGTRPGTASQLAAIFLLGPIIVLSLRSARGLQFPAGRHPLTIGASLGACALAVHVLRSLVRPGDPVLPPRDEVLLAAILIGVAAFALIISFALKRGGGRRGMFPLAVITASTLTAALMPPSTPSMSSTAIWPALVLLVVLASFLASSATGQLLEAVQEQGRVEAPARDILHVPRPRSPRDEELFHELRATVADITCASQVLLHHGDRLPPERRHRLEQMFDEEMHRLGRLVTGEPETVERVDLDDVLGPLVLGQMEQGHDVRWQPSGLVVRGRHDDVVEIVHVLLTNARRHGGGAPTTVTARAVDDAIELRVSDGGPGVEPELVARLFQRGACGRHSRGQGLGLHIAHRLADEHGGRLWLDVSGGPGATFVVSLPRAQEQPIEWKETS